ncbi:STAS domain-containing protein [Mycolicibacterium litorale]|nr:STAS domain-containing protein [Mycolicibacterium litorale]
MSDEPVYGTTHLSDGRVPSHGDGLAVEQSWVRRTVVLTVSGDLDMLTAPTLAEAIRSAARHAPTALIVDLSTVQFLASAGMTLLVTTQEELAPSIRFGVVADGPATSRPLRLVGVDRFVTLYRTLPDALVAVAER